MARLLADAGVAAAAIHPVPEGDNTISSLLASWPVLVNLTAGLTRGQVYVCTDRFHLRRCRAILRIWGAPTRVGARPQGEAQVSSYMFWRDRLALLKDLPLALWWRATRRVSSRRSGA